MIQKLFFTLFFSAITCASFSQNKDVFIRKEDNPELKVTVQAYFGISLLTSYDSFIRYGYIQVKSTGETQITYLSRAEFIMQISGQEQSKANPEKINFLEKYEIMWDSFENLWKVRYAEYPYDGAGQAEKGWAGRDFAPTESQWSFLKQQYGYGNFEQFLYGEAMWKLLKDSQDPNWQRQYSSLK